jgi:fructose-1,6-bisphosphatase I
VYDPDEKCTVEDMDNPDEMMKKCVADVCQPGNRLQCAGYVLYSSATTLVLTVGTGVFGFTLDPLVGEFVLTHDNIKIPEKGKIYSFNEGNYQLWDDNTKAYMDSLKDAEKWGGKPYSVRSPDLLSACSA